jgi:hypothetical protein
MMPPVNRQPLRLTKLARQEGSRHLLSVQFKAIGRRRNDLAARIHARLKGSPGLDNAELWQHALYFAMSPQERYRLSLKTARSALSLRRSAQKG